MGSRGASSGRANNGKAYGTEYRTVYQAGNIKYVAYNEANNAKPPMETMTNGRIYATVNGQGDVKTITYYDKHNKKHKQIDVSGQAHTVNGVVLKPPHTHRGYIHDEKGTRPLSPKEGKMLERVLKTWYNRNRK